YKISFPKQAWRPPCRMTYKMPPEDIAYSKNGLIVFTKKSCHTPAMFHTDSSPCGSDDFIGRRWHPLFKKSDAQNTARLKNLCLFMPPCGHGVRCRRTGHGDGLPHARRQACGQNTCANHCARLYLGTAF
ncbi:MAG TPA: hypothetical protein VHP34_08965, partial [Alphaproteobacteria bacterium]|nr:hypothetical protein [Alphaproteobacteria bacterium]